MPWTKEGAKSLWQAFPSESVETKTRTVHLAMRIPQAHKPIPHEGFRVLFLGTMNLSGPWNFYYRGGRRLLRVFGRFAKGKGDAQLLLTGEVPEQEEGLLSKTPNAKAVGILPKQELGLLFRTCDALLFPSYCTPGLAFLEAMRYHLPVITTDAWANRELVENGRNGLVSEFTRFDTHGTFNILPHNDDFTAFEKNQIDGRLEDSLVESLERLYCDRRLARLMGERGFGMVGSGRFCIERRNRELRKIYDGCL
jgi:glycosyltransferase involved in cell wall biosynthesis